MSEHRQETGSTAPILLFERGIDRGLRKVIVLASVLIIFSMLLVGFLMYVLTQRAVVDKLKKSDLVTIAESISSRVDARITRAIDTSLLLARDPEVEAWLAGGEREDDNKASVLATLRDLTETFDYSTAFIVSTRTNQYWNEKGRVLDVMSRLDEDDSWFFNFIETGQTLTVEFDHNRELGDTFAFIDVPVGDPNAPAAVAGVSMSLKELSSDFAAYQQGRDIRLWLVNRDGTVLLSDRYEENGLSIDRYVPKEAIAAVMGTGLQEIKQTEFEHNDSGLADLIAYPLQSTNLQLLVAVDRSETVAFLDTLKWNTLLVVLISFASILFFFHYVSRRLADPYKRAVQLNRELEAKVEVRTQELRDKNESILDSIRYAQRLQESILPAQTQLAEAFGDHFVIWQPRDLVGGDFYWMLQREDRLLIAVGDCTGHGVPGALMSMLAVSSLNRVVEGDRTGDPGKLLGELNRLMKRTLHREAASGLADDGLDIALCVIDRSGVRFAGAGSSLYVSMPDGIQVIKGDRRSAGYRRTPDDYAYTTHQIDKAGMIWLTSDGFLDQNGGDRNYSFGRQRFIHLLAKVAEWPCEQQREALLAELYAFAGGEPQRDDIAVAGFRIREESIHGIGGDGRGNYES